MSWRGARVNDVTYLYRFLPEPFYTGNNSSPIIINRVRTRRKILNNKYHL